MSTDDALWLVREHLSTDRLVSDDEIRSAIDASYGWFQSHDLEEPKVPEVVKRAIWYILFRSPK